VVNSPKIIFGEFMQENVQIKKRNVHYSSKIYIEKLNIYNQEINKGLSRREAAKIAKIPRSTLQEFAKTNENNFSPKVVEFIKSPEGFYFLNKLLMTMMFHFVISGFCGIRQFCFWLEVSGLSNFIASSFNTWREIASNMENKILDFEKKEREILAKNMSEKNVSIAIDETFFKEMCLVGIEPVSNFIFLEQYSEKRDAESWYKCITASTSDLKVKIVQIVGDQASGIISAAKNMFSSHYATDLFHIQREICKAGAIKIAGIVNISNEGFLKQKETVQKLYDKKLDLEIQDLSTKNIENKIKGELKKLDGMEKNLSEDKKIQNKFKESLLGISSALHPVNKDTGLRRGVSLIEAEINFHFDEIRKIFSKIKLCDNSQTHFKKAERAIPYLLSSISFFCTSVNKMVKIFKLTKEQEYYFHSYLVPSAYLNRISKHEKAKERIEIINRADELERKGLELFSEEQRKNILKSAIDAANIYQRSSSIVEGRNSSLSLKNHSIKKLTSKRLSVLTIIQNYYVKNIDGNTAAERFFEQHHSNLVDYIVENVLPAPRAYYRNK
jgi:hypothetical protein